MNTHDGNVEKVLVDEWAFSSVELFSRCSVNRFTAPIFFPFAPWYRIAYLLLFCCCHLRIVGFMTRRHLSKLQRWSEAESYSAHDGACQVCRLTFVAVVKVQEHLKEAQFTSRNQKHLASISGTDENSSSSYQRGHWNSLECLGNLSKKSGGRASFAFRA